MGEKQCSKSFSPGVMIDGKRYTPPGWMWVLSFALSGCEWAIKEADTDQFRERIRLWHVEKSWRDTLEVITDLERRIADLKKDL